MKLLNKQLEKLFPPLYTNEGLETKDIKIIAKFFDPTGKFTWYATEYDPKSQTFFGLVKGLECELGYFTLPELESIKTRFGLGIERDLHFGEHFLIEAINNLNLNRR